MVCSYRTLCGSAYTGSGVSAVPLNEFKDGEEDEEEEEEEEEILLSLSITSTCGSVEIRDGCRDLELMIDPYSVSDSSLGREQVDVKAINMVHLIDL